jgi:drug/metabolite transporter (DMT)-like permease
VNRRGFIIGFSLCLTGAICFSSKAVFVKLAYKSISIDSVSLLTLRMLFSMPFFVFSAFLHSRKENNKKFTYKEWLSVALVGCLGYYVSSLLDFIGLKYITAGMERLILFIYPTLVLLISNLLFNEKINVLQWVAIALCYFGIGLACWKELFINDHINNQFYYGVLSVFACAITYASYVVGSGKLIPVIGAAKFNSYAMSFASIAVVIHFLFASEKSLLDLTPTAYLYGFLMAIISTVIPSYLISESIKRIGSNNTAIISSVGPISTLFQAFIFLGEPIVALQLVGTAFILTGVLLISVKQNRSK